MSRTYARRREKLVAPIHRVEKPSWLTVDEKSVNDAVVELARKKTRLSDIGMILRDKYGVPDIKLVTGKGLKETITDMGIQMDLPDDLRDMMIKALRLHEHLDKNKKDMRAKRDVVVTESRIKSLAQYYIKKNVLPSNWRYSVDTAKLLIGR